MKPLLITKPVDKAVVDAVVAKLAEARALLADYLHPLDEATRASLHGVGAQNADLLAKLWPATQQNAGELGANFPMARWTALEASGPELARLVVGVEALASDVQDTRDAADSDRMTLGNEAYDKIEPNGTGDALDAVRQLQRQRHGTARARRTPPPRPANPARLTGRRIGSEIGPFWFGVRPGRLGFRPPGGGYWMTEG